MTEPKTARYCPRCSRPIQGARLVVVNAGEIFHHRCFVQDGGADDPLQEFLRRHYPSAFCADCLNAALTLTHDQVRRLVRASRSGKRLVMLLGALCDGCRQRRLTVQAGGYDDTQGTDGSRSLPRRRGQLRRRADGMRGP